MSVQRRYLIGDLDLTDWPFATQFDGDPGAPVNVAEVIDSMLQDGEIVSSSRSSNRAMKYTVFIEEADMDALAAAEAALMVETEKQRNTWTIDPGDGYAAVTVFDIFRVQVAFIADDEAEWQGYRRYDLTFPALPFGRGEDEVEHASLPAGASPSTVVIADGTSATNWAGSPGTVTSTSGYLTQSSAPTEIHSGGHTYTVTHDYTYTPGSPVDMSATTYLSVDYDPILLGTTNENRVTAYADGIVLPQVAEVALVSPAGWRRVTWTCPDTSVAAFRFAVFSRQFFPAGGGAPVVATMDTAIDNVQRSNQPPVLSSTGRQALRSITQGGSARSEGRFQLSHATAGLGDVIVFSCPSLGTGYTPDLRRWRTSGGTPTASASTVSGTRETFVGVTFNVPAAQLPRGGYLLYARVRATSGTPTIVVSATAATKIGSTLFDERDTSGELVTLNTTDWVIVPVGSVVLPTTDVPEGSAATVEITVSRDTGSVEWDEMWLFYAGNDSALTIASLGAGSSSLGTVHNRLWLDAPSLDRLVPAIWAGTLEDRSDAFHAGALASVWQVPSLPPGEVTFFVATTGATYAELTVNAYERFHTHAVQRAA